MGPGTQMPFSFYAVHRIQSSLFGASLSDSAYLLTDVPRGSLPLMILGYSQVQLAMPSTLEVINLLVGGELKHWELVFVKKKEGRAEGPVTLGIVGGDV